MPPKRTRKANNNGSSSSTPAITKKYKKESTVELPSKPQVDTYRPNKVESKDKIEAKVHELIETSASRLANKDVSSSSHHQLRLQVSNTEGDLLLGKDGKTNIEKIQNRSSSVIVVTDKVVDCVDREVIITGTIKEIIVGTLEVLYFLFDKLETATVDTNYHFIASIPDSVLEANPNLKNHLVNAEISTIAQPFSTFQTVYTQGRLPQLASNLSILLQQISNHSLRANRIPDLLPKAIPIIGNTIKNSSLDQINKKLIAKSDQALHKYLNQDYEETKVVQIDFKERTKNQIKEAVAESQKKAKTLEAVKHIIDIPVEYYSAIIGEGGQKIIEIRAKSNSNVVIDSNEVEYNNHGYHKVTITGLADSNLIALRYISGIVV